MQNARLFFIGLIAILLLVTIVIWTEVSLQAAGPAPDFLYPSVPPTQPEISAPLSAGMEVLVPQLTIICTDPDDLSAFWSSYQPAVQSNDVAAKQQAVNTALAASCSIAKTNIVGTIQAIGSDPSYVMLSPKDGTTPFWVKSASLQTTS